MNTRYKLKQRIINQENKDKLKNSFIQWNRYINNINKPNYIIENSTKISNSVELRSETYEIMNWFKYMKTDNKNPTINDLDIMGFSPIKNYISDDYYGDKLYTISVDNCNYIDAVVYNNMVVYVELLSNNIYTLVDNYIDYTKPIEQKQPHHIEYNEVSKENDIGLVRCSDELDDGSTSSDQEERDELDDGSTSSDQEERDELDDGSTSSDQEEREELDDGSTSSDQEEREELDDGSTSSDEEEREELDDGSTSNDNCGKKNIGTYDIVVPIYIGLFALVVTYLNYQSKYYKGNEYYKETDDYL